MATSRILHGTNSPKTPSKRYEIVDKNIAKIEISNLLKLK
jgi:hypothetical protein